MRNLGSHNRNLTQDIAEKKSHFKLYKSGKLWIVAGVTTLSFGLAQYGLTSEAHADTVQNEDSSVATSTEQSNSVALKTATAAPTDVSTDTGDTANDTNGSTAGIEDDSQQQNDASSASDQSTQQTDNDNAASNTQNTNVASSDPQETDADSAAAGTAQSDADKAGNTEVNEASTDTSSKNVSTDVDTTPIKLGSPQTKSLKTAVDSTDVTADDADAKATDKLPDGFTVSDPDYAADSCAASVANTGDEYIYYESKIGNYHIVISTNRTDANDVTATIVQKTGDQWQVVSTQRITGASYTDTHTGAIIYNDSDSVYILPPGSDMSVVSNVYGYLNGQPGTNSGDVVIKPMVQTQTTQYVNQDGEQIADSVTMTGLSGQKYTTSSSATLVGYDATESSNADGYMSPFIADNQQIVEVLHNSNPGTITYTVTDLAKGSITASWKSSVNGGPSYTPIDLTYTYATYNDDGTVKTPAQSSKGRFGNFHVINPYIPQTTTITYTYDASTVSITEKFVDENGDPILKDGADSVSVDGKYKTATTLTPPDITGYTYDQDYTATETDNPTSFTVTSMDPTQNIITFHYKANAETLKVNHVDQDGNPILAQDGSSLDTTIATTFNANVDLTKADANYNIDGYRLDKTNPTTYQITSDAKDGNSVTLTYTKLQTVTVNYVDQNGKAIAAGNNPTTLEGIKDEVLAVTSPTIDGYTAYPDNPTTYTVADGTNAITLRYVKTKIKVSVVEDGAVGQYKIVDEDGNTIAASTAVGTGDTNAPKWPAGVTDNSITGDGSDSSLSDLSKVVIETVNYYNQDMTAGTKSQMYVYYTQTGTVDFSNPDAPTITFNKDWQPVWGPRNVVNNETPGMVGSDFLPDNSYFQGVNFTVPKGATAFIFDSQNQSVPVSNLSFEGDTYQGLAAEKADSNVANTVFNVVYINDTDFTRTIHYKNLTDGTKAADDTVQHAFLVAQPSLDSSTGKLVLTLGDLTEISGQNSTFTALKAQEIDGLYALNPDVAAADVDKTGQTTATELTVNYVAAVQTVNVTYTGLPTNLIPTQNTVTGEPNSSTTFVPAAVEGYTVDKTSYPVSFAMNADGTLTTPTITVNYTANEVTADVDIPTKINGTDITVTVPDITGTTGQKITVTVPGKSGYTADKTTVPAVVNPDGTITTKTTVTYTPNAQHATVEFVDNDVLDANGKATVLKTDTLDGVSDQLMDLTAVNSDLANYLANGYSRKLTGTDPLTNATFDANDQDNQKITIYLTHVLTETQAPSDPKADFYNETHKNFVVTITGKTDDGQDVPQTNGAQTLHYKRAYVLDEVTGKPVSYKDWQLDGAGFTTVSATSLTNYTVADDSGRTSITATDLEAVLNKFSQNKSTDAGEFTDVFNYTQTTFTPSQPGTTDDTNLDALTKTVTENVTYGTPVSDGDPVQVISTTLYRTVTLQSDNAPQYSAWTTNTDGISKTASDQSVALQPLTDLKTPDGYTATVTTTTTQSDVDLTQAGNGIVTVTSDADDNDITVTRAVTYVPDNNTGATVSYLDEDQQNAVVLTIPITGDTDATKSYKIDVPAGYIVDSDKSNYTDGQTISITLKADDKDNVTVYLKHKTISVPTPTGTDDPTPVDEDNPEGPKAGDYYDDMNQAVTQTVHYLKTDQTTVYPDSVVTLNFTRTLTIDEVTKQPVENGYGEWTATTTDTFAAVTPQALAGYTISLKNATDGATSVAESQVNAEDADQTWTFIYTPDTDTVATVHYVDETTKQEVAKTDVQGTTDTTSNYQFEVPAGYQLSNNQTIVFNDDGTIPLTFKADDSDDVTINLTHATLTVPPVTNPDDKTLLVPSDPKSPTLGSFYEDTNASVNEKITYELADGTSVSKAIDETLNFTQSVTVDAVTYQIIERSGWKADSKGDTFAAVISPKIAGYKASIDSVSDQKVTADSKDISIKVVYTPNAQSGVVHFVDEAGNELADSVNVTGVSDGLVDRTTISPVIQSLINQNYMVDKEDDTGTKTFDTDDSNNQDFYIKFKLDANTTDYVLVPRTTNGSPIPGYEGGIPESGLPNTKVTVPDIPGYTVTTVPNTPSDNPTQTIVYTANAQTGTVHFVDQTGKELADTVTVSGVSNGLVDRTDVSPVIQSLINQNYMVDKEDDTGTETFDADDDANQDFYIKFKLADKTTDYVLVPRTTNGSPIPGYEGGIPESGLPNTKVAVPDIPGYTVTTVPDTPSDNPSQTIIYTPNVQKGTVRFVIGRGKGAVEIAPSVAVSGVSNGLVDRTEVGKTIQSLLNQNYLLGEDETGMVPFDTDDATDQTYTVYFSKLPDGQFTVIPKTPTGETIPGYETGVPETGLPGEKVTTPEIPGYTVSTTVPNVPTSKQPTVEVVYTPHAQAGTVHFVDETGQELAKSVEVTGVSDGLVDRTNVSPVIQSLINQNYIIKDDETGTKTFDANDDADQNFYIRFELAPKTTDYVLVPRTTNGSPIPGYEGGIPESGLPNTKVTVPDIPGYTVTTVPDTPSDNPSQTIVYTPNVQKGTVRFVTGRGKDAVDIAPSVAVSGVSNGRIDRTDVAKTIQSVLNQNYLIVDDDTGKVTFDANDAKDQTFTVTFKKLTGGDFTVIPKTPTGETIPGYETGVPETGLPGEKVTTPEIPGYTVTTSVPEVPTDQPTVDVVYTPHDQAGTVHFVDESGRELAGSVDVAGVSDGLVDRTNVSPVIQSLINQNYVIKNDETGTETFDADDNANQDFYITFKLATKTTDYVLVPRTTNGSPIPGYEGGIPESGLPNTKVAVPDIPGYTVTTVPDTPSDNPSQTIVYTPNVQKGTVRFVIGKDKDTVEIAPSVTVSGVSNGLVDRTEVGKTIQSLLDQNYLLGEDETGMVPFDTNDATDQTYTVYFSKLPNGQFTVIPKTPTGKTIPGYEAGVPESGQPGTKVMTPEIPGYTVTTSVPEVPTDQPTVEVVYTPHDQAGTVHFVDESGRELADSVDVAGVSDGLVDRTNVSPVIQSLINQNYIIKDDETGTKTFDANDDADQNFYIRFELAPKTTDYVLVPRTTNGSPIPGYEGGIPESGLPNTKVAVPDIPGYTVTTVPDTPSDNPSQTIVYTPNVQKGTVRFVTGRGKDAVEIAPSVAVSGVSNGLVDRTEVGKTIQSLLDQNYLLGEDETGMVPFDADDATDQTYTVYFSKLPDGQFTVIPKTPTGETIPGYEAGVPESGQPGTKVTTPEIPGYTVTTSVPEVPTDQPTVEVVYTPHAQAGTVHFVDETGQELAQSVDVSGVSDGLVDRTNISPVIQSLINQNYMVDKEDDTGTETFDTDDGVNQDFYIKFKLADKTTDYVLVPRTTNGSPIPGYEGGIPESGLPNTKVVVPDIPGYTVTTVPDTPSDNPSQTIVYTPNVQKGTVRFVTGRGKDAVKIAPSVAVSGVSNGLVDRTEVGKTIQSLLDQNYLLGEDETGMVPFDTDDATDQTYTVYFSKLPDGQFTVIPKTPTGETIPGYEAGVPESGQPGTKVTTPEIPGYTVTTSVPEVPTDQPTVDVVYTPHDQAGTVHFVDESGRKLAGSVDVTGVSDGLVDRTNVSPVIQSLINQNYVIKNDETGTKTFDADDNANQDFYVTFKLATKTTDYVLVPRTTNGSPIPGYEGGIPESGLPNTKVAVPDIPGYTVTTVPDTPTDNPAQTIIYVPDDQAGTVEFVDITGKKLSSDVAISGVSNGRINRANVIKMIQSILNKNYLLVSDGTGDIPFDTIDANNQTFKVIFKQLADGEFTVVPKTPTGETIPGYETGIPETGLPGEKVTTPEIPGYTVTTNVPEVPTDQPTVGVTYIPHKQAGIVQFVDQNGDQLSDGIVVNGVTDGFVEHDQLRHTIQLIMNQNYNLVSDDTATTSFNNIDDDQQVFMIQFAKLTAATYTETPSLPNGDPVPGIITTPETGEPGTKVNAPEIPGYTLISELPDVPTDGSDVKLTYVPNVQRGVVIFVDQNGKRLASIEVTGGSDTFIARQLVHGQIQRLIQDGYNLTQDGTATVRFDHDDNHDQTFTVVMTALPAPEVTNPGIGTSEGGDSAVDKKPEKASEKQGNTSVKRDSRKHGDTSKTTMNNTLRSDSVISGKNQDVSKEASTGQNRLPQTSEQSQSRILATLGLSLMSLLVMLGIVKRRKRDDDQNER